MSRIIVLLRIEMQAAMGDLSTLVGVESLVTLTIDACPIPNVEVLHPHPTRGA